MILFESSITGTQSPLCDQLFDCFSGSSGYVGGITCDAIQCHLWGNFRSMSSSMFNPINRSSQTF